MCHSQPANELFSTRGPKETHARAIIQSWITKGEETIYKQYARKYGLSWVAQEILIFYFSFALFLTPASLGISGSMDTKIKQKNFPALISVFLI